MVDSFADMDLVKPCADIDEYYGEDGRAGLQYIIRYSCPKCHKSINESVIGCAECKVFFDWKKKAKVQINPTIVWK